MLLVIKYILICYEFKKTKRTKNSNKVKLHTVCLLVILIGPFIAYII